MIPKFAVMHTTVTKGIMSNGVTGGMFHDLKAQIGPLDRTSQWAPQHYTVIKVIQVVVPSF